METIMNILQALLFIVKAGLAVSVILLLATLGTYVHDELQEMRVERSLELARNREDLSQLNTDGTTYFSEWVAIYRAAGKKPGAHRYDKTKPSYSQSREFAFAAPREPIYNDENFFAALIREKEEIAPLF